MSDLDLPSEIAGRYRPIRMVGKGGMGAVYEVEHVDTGQRLALKVLTRQPGASVERFKREARATSQIKSDHIVRVTDAGVAPELDGAPFIVMELLDGTDLEHATHDEPAAPEDVVEWLRQVARALTKAHEAGIVHRDLKPENLFLTHREDGTPLVKVLDFGIAKVAGGDLLTHSNQFLGTPLYMAPEQADSSGAPITLRGDIYSLGLIGFKLLHGRSYWGDATLTQLLGQMLAGPMPPPSERGSTLGPAFDEWFLRACHRDPAQRFPSVGEQVEALAAALGLPARAASLHSTPVHAAEASSPRVVRDSFAKAPTLEASFTDIAPAKPRAQRAQWLMIGAVVMASAGAAVMVTRGAGKTESVVVRSADVAASSSAPPAQRSTPAVEPTTQAAVRTEVDAAVPTTRAAVATPSSARPRPVSAPLTPPRPAASASASRAAPRDPLGDQY